MSSIIEGYSYDIFISYRQNDNKYDGWVTEFVDNLNKELEANIKEKVSVYFDINPQDGLLETHSVDRSLEEKLKCLIFIPIISRTYCDSKSFAWQHEFCAFNKLSKEAPFGRDIRLSSGNVTNRILPVKIYDLDSEDKTLLENELGGVLRSIEFIYKSAGVNRPLRTNEDHPQDNLNKTYYRDQINKVANAVKEIITALIKQSQHQEEVKKQESEAKPAHQKNLKAKIILTSAIVLAMIVLGYFFIPKLFKSSKPVEKSIAVLPFSDFSVNHDQEYFANGMMEEILNQLAKIHDLEVISRTSSMIYKDSKLPLKSIAHELGVSNIVEGSVQKAGNRVRITVQLIDGNSENHLWSESYDRNLNDIFSVQTEIALNIARELKSILTSREEDLIRQIPTKNFDAYDFYLMGIQSGSDLDWDQAIKMFSKAIELDPEFTLAYVKRASYYSTVYFTKGDYFSGDWGNFNVLAKADLEKALKIDPELPEVKYEKAEQLYRFDRKHEEALEILNELESQMPNNPSLFSLRSFILRRKGRWEESLNDQQRSIILDPLDANNYNQIGHTYRLMRKYPEAVSFFNKSDARDLKDLIHFDNFFVILEWEGDLNEAAANSALSVFDLGQNPNFRDNYFYYSREFDKLIPTAALFEDQFYYIPRSLNMAQVYFLKSNASLSRLYADSAITELNVRIKSSPYDERYYSSLGFAYAYKGEKKKSIEFALKAVKLKPIELDVWQGYKKEEDLARIYVLTDEYDMAMDKIEYLLTIPGDLSVPLLKIDPAYDKLRQLPRFQKILATEYKTKYQ